MNKDEIKEILEALRDSIDDTGTDKVNFINWVDKIEDYIINLQQANKHLDEVNCKLRKTNEQLKDNWNTLKKFLKNTRKENLEWDKKHNCEWKGYNAYSELLIKMQELEQGSDD